MTKMTKRHFAADQTRLGFIGVGAMGSRIVRRLRDHGYEVAAYDRDQGKVEALVPYGVSGAQSLAELAANADVILSCLTNDEAVRSVYLASDGVLAGPRRGNVVLEMSTIAPGTSRDVHAQGARQGVNVMDVAISGSTPAVETGNLTLLAGGDAELFQAAEPIFQVLV
jgi:3-hydroxyisobutyrate dehydrogenase